VDTQLFRPRPRGFLDLPRPVWLYFGRVAVEKGIEDFLRLDLPGTRLVVGDGPGLPECRRRHPEVVYAGYRHGEELASYVAAADVFVFPSRTDTFGLVLLEALAAGTPVAAYPVTGPLDVIGGAAVGALDEDLRAACLRAMGADRALCRAHAERFSWTACARRFRDSLVPVAG
jgi:glycosyltransferase involved in cell wall biosynthesis